MVERIVNVLLIASLLLFLSCNKKQDKISKGIRSDLGSVIISPENAKTYTDIRIAITLNKKGATLNDLEYNWYINDNVASKDRLLSKDLFKKGDRIQLKISLDDKTSYSNEILVKNSIPVISFARIVKENNKLYINGKFDDNDNDSVDINVNWHKDNKLVKNSKSIALNEIGNAKSLYAVIIPFDGYDSGVVYKTAEYRVVNSSPMITSTPNMHLDGNTFTYNVIAEDPENDHISFSLIEPPEGANIDPSTGILTYIVPDNFKGDITLKIKVDDNHGNSTTQQFSYTIK
jgi:hypothetical protein